MNLATLRWIFCFAILAAPVSAAEGWTNYDGDTVRTPSGVTVRLPNVDAPETGSRCRCALECGLGARATAYTRAQLERARVVRLEPYPRPYDKYGRTLAYVLVDGVDLGESLIAAKLARPWAGRRERWC